MKESGMRSTRIKTKPNEIRRPKNKEGKGILIRKKTKQNRTKVEHLTKNERKLIIKERNQNKIERKSFE